MRMGRRRELALAGLAMVWARGFGTEEEQRLVQESLAIARETAYYPALSWALIQQSAVYLARNAYAECEACLSELLALSREADDPRSTGVALAVVGHLALARKQLPDALKHYQEGLRLLKTIGLQWAIGRLNSHLGDVNYAMGAYADARSYHRAALASYRDVGVYWKEESAAIGGCYGIPISLQRLGDIDLVTGQVAEARRRYGQALEAATDSPEPSLRLHLLLGPARLLFREGDTVRAVELASLALHHPAGIDETRAAAQEMLNGLRAELSLDVCTSAEERGRARDLDATVQALLDELRDDLSATSGQQGKDAHI